jgi:hypothetical protein
MNEKRCHGVPMAIGTNRGGQASAPSFDRLRITPFLFLFFFSVE